MNNVSKTLWTRMMAAVLEYSVSSPAVLLDSLTLLSQLLPLLLPLPSSRHLSQSEQCSISTSRKLWSAHLHPLHSQISALIVHLSSYSKPSLTPLIQKVVDQLASLSPPIAVIIISGIVSDISNSKDNIILIRQLQFLEWSLRQPSLKTVTCDRLSQDEVFRASLLQLINTGLESSAEDCQFCCVRIIEALLDLNITMSLSEDEDQRIADSLPDKDTILQLVSSILGHLADETVSVSTQDYILKSLMTMTQSEILLNFVKVAVLTAKEGKEMPLMNYLRKIVVEFSPHNEILNTCLTSFMSLVSSLQEKMSLEEISESVSWNSCQDSGQEMRRTHPLTDLLSTIKSSEPDLAMTSIQVSFTI